MRLPKRFLNTIGVFVLVVGIFYLGSSQYLGSYIGSFFERPLALLSRVTLPATNLIKNIATIFSVINERDELRDKMASVSFSQSVQDALRSENELLRQQLNLKAKQPNQLVEAHIIVRNSNLLKDTIAIDKGLEDGLKEGMAVVLPGNILIGKLTKVFDGNSDVQLITEGSFVTSAKIVGSDVVGDLKSRDSTQNSTSKILDLIKSDEAVKHGDVLVTSGIDGLPQGLLLGLVDVVTDSDGALFKSITVDLFFRNFKNPIVFVVKSAI